MTHTELKTYIKKVFPNESDADIALHLTEASRDFTSRTKILKGVETFNTVIDQRYYDLNDLDGDGSQRHIVEVNKVDYDNYTIQRLITFPDEVDIT
mgnify:CR=1 FL=1|tara:strand:- start:805 stop:1092 length:288 start_codon:yes stop_codon:yes gene_type:complete